MEGRVRAGGGESGRRNRAVEGRELSKGKSGQRVERLERFRAGGGGVHAGGGLEQV